MKHATPDQSKTPKPQDVRDDLQEKAPRSQRGDKAAGLQPNEQDSSDRARGTRKSH